MTISWYSNPMVPSLPPRPRNTQSSTFPRTITASEDTMMVTVAAVPNSVGGELVGTTGLEEGADLHGVECDHGAVKGCVGGTGRVVVIAPSSISCVSHRVAV